MTPARPARSAAPMVYLCMIADEFIPCFVKRMEYRNVRKLDRSREHTAYSEFGHKSTNRDDKFSWR